MNANLSAYKLDSPLRLSHFFAQVRVEVGDEYALIENLNYRPARLLSYSYFRNRPGVQRANQIEIANRAYNGVTGVTGLGNGDIGSGDGWKFIGRGLKQLTGRYNYAAFTTAYPQIWPGETPDFVSSPELLEQPKYALRSAVFFWLKNELYNIEDKVDAPTFVNSITAKINRYTDSYDARIIQFERIWKDEKIFR